MSRLTTITALGLAAIATLNAGQIQVGATSGGFSSGLTQAYTGLTASASERRWKEGVFSSAIPVTNPGTTEFLPAWVDNTPGAPTYLTDTNGINFARNSDPGVGTTETATNTGAWVTGNNLSSTSTNNTITIPVAVSGVTQVYAMLNDYWGGTGLVNTQVIFNWQTAGAESVSLTNGAQIRSALTGSATTSTGLTIATTLTSGAVGLTSSLGANVNVTASNLLSFQYSGTGATNRYSNTSGNVVLDEQLFDFGSLRTADTLLSITIRSQLAPGQSGSGTQSIGGQDVTRAALSAVTVVTAVPEPSTIMMALSGLGLVAFARRRRKA